MDSFRLLRRASSGLLVLGLLFHASTALAGDGADDGVIVARADVVVSGSDAQTRTVRVASHGVKLRLEPRVVCQRRSGEVRDCREFESDANRSTRALPLHALGLIRVRVGPGVARASLVLECGQAERLGSANGGRVWRFRVSNRQGVDRDCDRARLRVRFAGSSGVGAATTHYRLDTKPDSPWRNPYKVVKPRVPVAGFTFARGPGRLAVALFARGTVDVVPASRGQELRASRAGGTTLQYAVRTSTAAGFGAPVTITRRHIDHRLAMAPDGTIWIGWTDLKGRIHVATLDPRRGVVRERVVSAPGVNEGFELEVNNQGTLVLGWARGPSSQLSTYVLVKVRGSPWGTPELLSTDGLEPLIELAPDGSSVVAWEAGYDQRGLIRVATLDPQGAVESIAAIPNSRQSNDGFDLALADDGSAAVLIDGRPFTLTVRQSVRKANETAFPDASRLFPPRQPGLFSAVESSGARRFHAVWWSVKPPGIRVGTYRSGRGSWSTPKRLSRHGRDSFEHHENLAFGARGAGATIWTRVTDAAQLYGATHRPGHGWGRPELIVRYPNQIYWNLTLAVNRSGVATAAWSFAGRQHSKGLIIADRWP